MSPEEFVASVRRELDERVALYLTDPPATEVGLALSKLALSPEDRRILNRTVATLLAETYYGVLLALDGAASLGGVQQCYSLHDETGAKLSGELEGLAWEQLMASPAGGT